MRVDGRGRTVGPYRLEDEIGRGGMGVVYRATKLDTGETVALKLMLPEIAANQQFRARFVREASLGSDLDHPHIVPIYDAGEIDGELFLAMRLIEGRDLKQLLEQEGRLEPRRVLSIMRQVAGALDAAHGSGVVHHDIKPQNILMSDADTSTDRAYVTDFGLVKPAGSESTNSRTGAQVFGSIQYMPPEQVEGMAADGRADVYALGCVLYECLTGEIPFDRPNEVAVLWAHVHEAPARVTDRRPELPGGLDAVVATAMAKHPDDRFLTCGELVEEFEKGLDRKHRPVVMPTLRPLVKRIPRPKTEREVWAPNFFPELSRVRKLTDRTNWAQVVAVAGVLCLLAASLVQFGRQGGIPQAAADVVDLVQKAGDGVASALVDSSDGGDDPAVSEVDPRRREGREGREFVRGSSSLQPSGGSATPPARPQRGAGGGTPARSGPAPAAGTMPLPPAAPKIVWVSAKQLRGSLSDLWMMSPDGERKTQLTDTATADENWPDWSPDGKRLVYIRDGDIWIMNADGSEQRALSLCSMERPCSEPEWSPDGNRIVYSAATEDLAATETSTSQAAIFVLDLVSGRSRRVPGLLANAYTEGGSVVNATWSPDGRSIAGICSKSETLCVVRPDGTVVKSWDHSGVSVAWSPDGTIAMEAGSFYGKWDICLQTWNGSTCTDLLPQAEGMEPSWSSDGAALVYADMEQRRYFYGEIYRVDADGSNPVRLTNWPETTDVQPDWWGPAS